MDINDVQIRKQLGNWKPNAYLSNYCMSFYESDDWKSKRLFPVCPVQTVSGYYYTFSKADLARDNVRRKPDYGSVAPAIMGVTDDTFNCRVYQVKIGIDELVALAYQRGGAVGSADPVRARIPMINEQINLHQELDFAANFFKPGIWQDTWTGAATDNVNQKKFKKFSDATSDPISFIEARAIDIRRNGRRKPNKLALGIETYVALKNHEKIKERIKYTGTNQSPAVVNENVLAQIFGVEQVVVLDSTFNAGNFGQEDMQFICDSKGALLMYAPDEVRIDEPSAVMAFTWQIFGNDLIAIDTFRANDGSHCEFVEAIIAYDLKKTSDCLACFMTECVA